MKVWAYTQYYSLLYEDGILEVHSAGHHTVADHTSQSKGTGIIGFSGTKHGRTPWEVPIGVVDGILGW